MIINCVTSKIQMAYKHTQHGGDHEVACVNSTSDMIISALPSQRGWTTSELKQFQGFWLDDWVMPGVLSLQEKFCGKSDHVVLTSSPKSGTTWLKALLFSITNRSSYKFDDAVDDGNPLLSRNPHVSVPYIDFNATEHLDDPNPDLSLLSTHLPYSLLPKSMIESGCRFVHVMREPKDLFISLWHFAVELRKARDQPTLPLDDAFDMFCNGLSQYGPYWDYELEYWNASLKCPDKFCIMTYEDLMKRPDYNVRKLASFIEKPFTAAEEDEGVVEAIVTFCSFDKLSNLEVNRTKTSSLRKAHVVPNKVLFRKATIGDWKNYLIDKQRERIDQTTYQKFQGTDLLDLLST
uniref:Sulfotransferase n=1 Tax=Kalanchoe fedtschenkoi TaxID=63787 RepID=A0A7N0TE61_KALFE